MHTLSDDFGYSQKQRRADLEADRYTMLFDLVTSELEREFVEEGGFGEYKPDGAMVHRIVERRMAAIRNEQ